MHCIGMDVHANVTMICVRGPDGRVVERRTVQGPLAHVVGAVRVLQGKYGSLRVCYEASTGAGWLHDELRGLGVQVRVAHPGQVRMIFRAKRKNDRIDAEKLSLLAYLDQVPLAHIPSAERRRWRSVIEYRRRLVERRGAVKNRLRTLLRSRGEVAPAGLWTKAGQAWLTALALSEEEALQRDLLLEELASLKDRLGRLEKHLAILASRQPAVSLLMTMPGVGIRTAEAVAAYVDDPHRFRRTQSIGCYFGLVPCEDTSVKSRFGHITKEGPSTVRKYLTEATWQAIRRDATVRAYYERIVREDPNRRKIALVATAHHLLRVMLAMLRTGESWRTAPGPQAAPKPTGNPAPDRATAAA
jgi:transposase